MALRKTQAHMRELPERYKMTAWKIRNSMSFCLRHLRECMMRVLMGQVFMYSMRIRKA